MASNSGINLGGIYADLELNTGNTERGLANARKAMALIEGELKQLQSEFQKGALSATDYADRISALAATQSQLQTRMNAAYTATKNLHTGLEILDAKAKMMTNSAGRMGQSMMQLGYIADDLQYGFSGVVNNIAPLVYGFSGSAGVATAAQVAAVGVYQLYVNWDRLMDAMEVGRVRTEAEEMDALAKATSKTAEETEKLAKYKREQAEIDQMAHRRPDEEVKGKKAVQDAIANADVDKVAKGVFETMRATGRGSKLTPEEVKEVGVSVQAERDKKRGWFEADETTKQQHDAEVAQAVAAKETEQDHARTKDLMRGSTDDPGKLREMLALVDANPAAFPPGMAKDLTDQLPENRAQQAEWERQGGRRGEMIPRAMKERDQAKRQYETEHKKELNAEAKERRDENTRKREGIKQDIEVAKLVDPQIEAKTRLAVAQGMLAGKTKDEVVDQVAKSLMSGNEGGAAMSQEDARTAAGVLVNEQGGKLNDDINRRALRGGAEASKSEVYSSSDLTRRIQSAISDTDGKKQLTELEKIRDYLATLARQQVFKISVES